MVTTQETETHAYTNDERSYKFEGYQIYQLKDATVSVTDLGDETKARLVAQCDIENYYDTTNTLPIGKLVNYEMNGTIGAMVPSVKVVGANKGIQHSFRINTDAFAVGQNTKLVNNKEYYFIAVAYAHNRYKAYDPTDATKLDGQKAPYLAGRKNEKQGSIEPIKVMPHDPSNENGGTIIQAAYGDSPEITRIEGFGNGNNILRVTEKSIEELMGAPGVEKTHNATMDNRGVMNDPWIIANPVYEKNYGPVSIIIVDPLSVKPGEFYIKFNGIDSSAMWTVSRVDGQPIYDDVYTVNSEHAIGRYNEQLILDLGISIRISDGKGAASELEYDQRQGLIGGFVNDGSVLSATMEFEDVTKSWLTGFSDNDNVMVMNWIRSGNQFVEANRNEFLNGEGAVVVTQGGYLDEDYYKSSVDEQLRTNTFALDKNETFEKVLQISSVDNGTWAPYGLVSLLDYHPAFSLRDYVAERENFKYGPGGLGDNSSTGYNRYAESYDKVYRSFYDHASNSSLLFNDMSEVSSIRVVITKDKSKWTRCPVLEMSDDYSQSEGNARRFQLRKAASVDKEGNPVPDGSDYAYGMGWFPGYVINLETGERLNVMFGEDSRYPNQNGKDMLWNPTSTLTVGSSDYVIVGRHYLYILGANKQMFRDMKGNSAVSYYNTPSYDEGKWAWKMLTSLERLMTIQNEGKGLLNGLVASENSVRTLEVRDSSALLFSSVMWVNMPLAVSPEYEFKSYDDIPCDVTIDLNVSKPYAKTYSHNGTAPGQCGLILCTCLK